MKIKKGDKVLIISGKDKSRTGKVLRVFPSKDKVMVEGINIRKKHVRARKSGEKGQTIEISLPINVSNIKLICSKCGKPARISYNFIEGKKQRVCKKCNQET